MLYGQQFSLTQTPVSLRFMVLTTLTPPQVKGLEGVSLKLWLVSKRQYHTTSSGPPRCRYVNVSVLPGSSIRSGGSSGALLLENPVGENVMSYERLILEVPTVVVFVFLSASSVCVL